MAWHERDYYREPPGSGGFGGFGGSGGGFSNPFSGGQWKFWSVTTWLIIINVAIFIIDQIVARFVGWPPFYVAGYFSADTAIMHGQVWRLITFQFLHADLWHILINMLLLFFFGRFVESYLGSPRYLAFYLLCGIAGTAGYMLLWGVGLIVGAMEAPLIGASAGVFGVLIGTAIIAPDARVLFMFIFPMQMRTVAWIALGVAAFVVLAQGNEPGANAGGEAAHLGGAGLGFLLIRYPHWLDWADRVPTPGKASPTRKVKQKFEQVQQAQRQREEQEVDRILDKVKEKGLQSLTRQEKKVLNRATERQKQRR